MSYNLNIMQETLNNVGMGVKKGSEFHLLFCKVSTCQRFRSCVSLSEAQFVRTYFHGKSCLKCKCLILRIIGYREAKSISIAVHTF